MGRAGERLGRAGKHPGEDTTNVSFDVCPCRVRTRSSGCVVQSPDSWKGAETCRCRREEAGRCPWWLGHTNKVPQGIHHPPASPIPYFQHWPLIPVYGWFCSVAISFLLLVSVPMSGEEPALPSLSSYPDLGRPQSRAVCEPLCGTRLGLGWGQALGGCKRRRAGGDGH